MNIPMNPKVKALWVEALRSGEYTQSFGALRKDGTGGSPKGFCCLGVLCDLAVKAGVIPEPIHQGDEDDTYRYGDNEGTPPRQVLEWAEMTHIHEGRDAPTLNREGHFHNAFGSREALVVLNDVSKLSFEEIANLIEESF